MVRIAIYNLPHPLAITFYGFDIRSIFSMLYEVPGYVMNCCHADGGCSGYLPAYDFILNMTLYYI